MYFVPSLLGVLSTVDQGDISTNKYIALIGTHRLKCVFCCDPTSIDTKSSESALELNTYCLDSMIFFSIEHCL